MARLKLKQIAGPGINLANHIVTTNADGSGLDYVDIGSIQQKGPLGYYATSYTVSNIAERDSIDASKVHPGDQVFVADAGNGSWGQYVASNVTSGSNPTVTWTQIANASAESSDSTAKSVTYTFTYQTTTPVTIATLKPSAKVIEVYLDVDQNFDQSASITIGNTDENIILMDNDHVDLTEEGNYMVMPNYQYSSSSNEEIKLYMNPGSSTTGEAKITVSYI